MVYSRDLPKMAVMDHLGFSWTTILDYFLGLLSWTILDLIVTTWVLTDGRRTLVLVKSLSRLKIYS